MSTSSLQVEFQSAPISDEPHTVPTRKSKYCWPFTPNFFDHLLLYVLTADRVDQSPVTLLLLYIPFEYGEIGYLSPQCRK